MSMDLPDLLDPERIRCGCDIHSKKRALQTVAELLGASLRRAAAPDAGEAEPGADPASGAVAESATGAGGSIASADGSSASAPAVPANAGAPASSGAGTAVDAADDEPPTRVANLEIGAKRERGSRKGAAKKAAAEAEAEAGEISDMDILDALIVRERLGSTGIGHGVALPHSRLATVDTPLAAMITLNEGVDFESVDGEPVDIVLGLLVPQDCNDEHLKILANLARRFADGEFRDALREHDSGDALYEHLQQLASRA